MDGSHPPASSRAGLVGARPAASVLALCGLEAALLVGWLVAGRPEWVARHLALSPLALAREPWQLATAGLVHLGVLAGLMDVLALWVFGSAVAERRGGAVTLALFAAAQLLGLGAAALVAGRAAPAVVIAGCGAGVMALVAAFGRSWGDTPLALFGVLAMKARSIAVLLVSLSLVAALLRRDWVGLALLGTGATVGAVAGARSGGRLQAALERRRMRRLRRRYRVIQGGRA